MAEEAAEWKAKGNAALSAEKLDEAIECYTKAIELDSTNHVFYSNRSAAYLKKGDAENALKDGDKAITANPTWPKGYGRKGAALHELSRLDDAVAAYEEGLSKAPGNEALVSGLEDVKREQARRQAGSGPGSMFPGNPFGPDMFGKLAANPKFAPYLADPTFLSTLQGLQKDPNSLNSAMKDPRVMEVLAFLIGIPTDGADGGFGMGADPSEESSTRTASAPASAPAPAPPPPVTPLTEEEKAMAAKKAEADALKAQGTTHYKAREFEQALKCYSAAEDVNPDPGNIVYQLNQAAVWLEMKDFDKSIEVCRSALETGRENRAPFSLIAKAWARIGAAEARRGNLDAAIDAYESSLVESHSDDVQRKLKKARVDKKKADELSYLDPEMGEKAKAEGNEAFKAGDFPTAIKLYDEAIKRDPTKATYFCNRGAAKTKVMDFNSAMKDIEKAITLDPKYVKAYSRKGALQFLMKEYHKAMETYRAGLEIDPEHSECQDGLRRTVGKINESQSGEMDQERQARAMADPEIQAILRDPMVSQALKDMQENPASARAALNDPHMSAKLSKLVAAGVLQIR